MARASIYAMAQLGMSKFVIYNRTVEHTSTEALALYYTGKGLLPKDVKNRNGGIEIA